MSSIESHSACMDKNGMQFILRLFKTASDVSHTLMAESPVIARTRANLRIMEEDGYQQHEQGDLEMMLAFCEREEIEAWFAYVETQAALILAGVRIGCASGAE